MKANFKSAVAAIALASSQMAFSVETAPLPQGLDLYGVTTDDLAAAFTQGDETDWSQGNILQNFERHMHARQPRAVQCKFWDVFDRSSAVSYRLNRAERVEVHLKPNSASLTYRYDLDYNLHGLRNFCRGSSPLQGVFGSLVNAWNDDFMRLSRPVVSPFHFSSPTVQAGPR